MPGYAYPIGVSGSGSGGEVGNAGSVNFRLSDDVASQEVFEATTKTKVTSILLTNNSGGSLPVDILLNKNGSALTGYLAKGFRVHKRRYMVQPLVSGDTRVDQEMLGDALTLTELILEPGDTLRAYCPIENAVDITINYLEGIN